MQRQVMHRVGEKLRRRQRLRGQQQHGEDDRQAPRDAVEQRCGRDGQRRVFGLMSKFGGQGNLFVEINWHHSTGLNDACRKWPWCGGKDPGNCQRDA
jgi:hypothetical protein